MRSIKVLNARSEGEAALGIALSPATAVAELGVLAERAAEYAANAQAANTRLTYRKALAGLGGWCAAHGLPVTSDGQPELPMQAEVIAAFMTQRADEGVAVSSLRVLISAVADAHAQARLVSPLGDPDLRLVWKGIRRTKGRPKRQAYPLTVPELRVMILRQRWGLKAVRDRCAMLLGFAGAARPEELVAVEAEHITPLDQGRLKLTFPHSKGDPERQGQDVVIPRGSDRVTCAVSAFEDWLLVSGVTTGPIFGGVQYGALTGQQLHAGDISKILKNAARRAGLPKAKVGKISAYSLRRGLATTARREGRSVESIQRQLRHKNINTTLGYIADEELARAECAAEGIGL